MKSILQISQSSTLYFYNNRNLMSFKIVLSEHRSCRSAVGIDRGLPVIQRCVPLSSPIQMELRSCRVQWYLRELGNSLKGLHPSKRGNWCCRKTSSSSSGFSLSSSSMASSIGDGDGTSSSSSSSSSSYRNVEGRRRREYGKQNRNVRDRQNKVQKNRSMHDQQEENGDVDLISVLEIASLDELEEVYAALHASSMLSPIGKSMVTRSRRYVLPSTRTELIRIIEKRFRFLAANAMETLRGKWPSYRQTLLELHDRLHVTCSSTLETADLEAEIFLHLLKEHAHEVDASMLDDMSMQMNGSSMSFNGTQKSRKKSYKGNVGDGMASAMPGSAQMTSPSGRMGKMVSKFKHFVAPLKFGSRDIVPVLQKLGASVVLTNAYKKLAQHLGGKLASRMIMYDTLLQTGLVNARGLSNFSGHINGKHAIRAAHKGLRIAATRYSTARVALQVMGPVLWASMLIDIACMSVGTDYSRVLRAVFCLAQIRLTRTAGWVNPND